MSIKLNSVYDSLFKEYGLVHCGYNTDSLCQLLKCSQLPDKGTSYTPSVPELENCEPIFSQLKNNIFGGLPIQLGMCMGKNNKLNCLEFHRCNEILVGTHEYILLLAKLSDIEYGQVPSDRVKAFLAPAGIPIEIFSSTLHYSPCNIDAENGFRVAVALVKGTNIGKTDAEILSQEDRWLWSCNKWLLAHENSDEAAEGAAIGIAGSNISV